MKAWTEKQRQKERNCKNCLIRLFLAAVGIFVVALCMYELQSLQNSADPEHRAALFGDPDRFLVHKIPAEVRYKQKVKGDDDVSREERKPREHLKDEVLRNHRNKGGNRRKTTVNGSIDKWIFVLL